MTFRIPAVGDSNLVASHLAVADRWITKFAALVPDSVVNLRAYDGNQAADCAYETFGYTSAPGSYPYGAYAPQAGDRPILAAVLNDSWRYGADPAKQTIFKRCWLACALGLALPARLNARPSGLSATPAAAWGSTQVSPIGRYCDAGGSKISGSMQGSAMFAQFTLQDSPGAITSVRPRIGGAALPDIDVRGTGLTTQRGRAWAPGAMLLSDTVDPIAPLSVELERLTPTSSPIQRLYVDSLIANQQTPQPLVVLNCHRHGAAAYASYASLGFQCSDAIVEQYNDVIAGMVALLNAIGLDVRLVDVFSHVPGEAHFSAATSTIVAELVAEAYNGPPVPQTYRDAVVKFRVSDSKIVAFDGATEYVLN